MIGSWLVLFVLTFAFPAYSYSLEPPPGYAGKFNGRLSIIRVPFQRVHGLCSFHPNPYACSYRYGSLCRIVLPNDVDPTTAAALERHERAHCNGWRH